MDLTNSVRPACYAGGHLTAQIWKIMRLTTIFLFALSLHVSASGHAQKVTLSLKDASLKKVFIELNRQTGYNFLYSDEVLTVAKKVTISVRDASLEEVLKLCFKNQPLDYQLQNNAFVIKYKANSVINNSYHQSVPILINVGGKITDPDGNPLVGASIKVKGANQGTTTDSNGEFTLKDVDGNAVLEISYVGFEPATVRVDNRSSISLSLKRSESKLDEIQVIAYGTSSKRFNTGSVSKVSQIEIEMQPVSNIISALQGRMAGVFIQTMNGLPGGNITVKIRGRGSLASGIEPLYIIDGVPFSTTSLSIGNLGSGLQGVINPFNSISPADIESVEVLKDADATAIYGSRAANGVVMITTKKGQSGKTKVDVNFSQGFSKITSRPKYLNLQEYLEIRREAFANSGRTPSADINSDDYAPDLTIWDQHTGTDWIEYALGGTASTSSAQVSLTGGNAQTNFLVSGNYRNEETFLQSDSRYSKGGTHLNLRHSSLNNKFKMSASFTYTVDNSFMTNASRAVFSFAPNYPIYDTDGKYTWIDSRNPVAEGEKKVKNQSDNLITSASLNYILLPGLSLSANVGFTKNSLKQINLNPKSSLNPSIFSGNFVLYGNNTRKSLILEPQINYTKKWSKANLDLLLGGSWQKSITDGNTLRGNNYSNESLFESYSAAGRISNIFSIYNEYKYASVFNRITFHWNKKYILNGSIRRDGSSKFGPGNQFGNFGAVGAAWVFSEEKFINNSLNFLSFGKLRGSYGITGNDQIADYQYLSLFTPTSTTYQGVSGLSPYRIANADYKWESTKKLEAALDLGFLNDKIVATIAWYQNLSDNQLVSYKVPYQTGFSSYQANFPAVIQNNGWELELTSTNMQTDNLTWKSSLNLTIPKNNLKEFPGIESSSYNDTYIIGEDLDVVIGFLFAGVDPQTGMANYFTATGDITENPSYYTDRTIIGKTSPDFYGGFYNAFTYKGLQLDGLLQFTRQHNYSKGSTSTPGAYMDNEYITSKNRWQKPGDITSVPKAGLNSDYSYLFSTAAWANTSYIRLKNISLSYSLPAVLSKRIKAEQCRFFINAQNLLTLSLVENGYDPESPLNSIPPIKTIVAGVQLTF